MKNVYLHGELGELYGKEFSLNIKTPIQAIKLLGCQIDGFMEDVKKGNYRFIKDNEEMVFAELICGMGAYKDLHIVPEISGSKKQGLGKIIAGVAVASLAFGAAPAAVALDFSAGASGGLGATAFSAFGISATYGNVALFGASMALGGVAQLLSPTPNVSSYAAQERPDQRASFILQGPTNTIQEGNPVPIVYGKMLTGSILVSAGLTTEQI